MDCQKVRERTRELQQKISAIDGVKRTMAAYCQMISTEVDTIPELMEEVQALERKRDRLQREIADLDRTLHAHRVIITDVAREILHGPSNLPLMQRRLGNLVDVLSNWHFNPDTLRTRVLF